MKNKALKINRGIRQQRLIAWAKPPYDFVKLNVAGMGTSANPRDLATGGICRDSQGLWSCYNLTVVVE